MSTKALFLALEKLDSLKGADNPWTQPAWAELEAIEKAATALGAGPPGVLNDAAIDSWLDLGERIAAQRSGGTTGAKEVGASGPQE